MNDLLLDLPSATRAKLIAALESGYLSLTPGVIGLRAALGRVEQAEALVAALHELHALGMSPRGAAAALRAIERVAARQRSPDLVLSGLQLPGTFARDTRMVYNELLGSAERSVGEASRWSEETARKVPYRCSRIAIHRGRGCCRVCWRSSMAC